MANITAAMVKELRETTSAGMMDCKAALRRDQRRHGGRDRLRKKGLSKAAKKAGRGCRGPRGRRVVGPHRDDPRGELRDRLRRPTTGSRPSSVKPPRSA